MNKTTDNCILIAVLIGLFLLTSCGPAASNPSSARQAGSDCSKPVAVESSFIYANQVIEDAIDGNENTFVTTGSIDPITEQFYIINSNQHYMIFDMGQSCSVSGISVRDFYTNSYALGDLEVLYSDNGSDWSHKANFTASNFIGNAGQTELDVAFTARYFKFIMTYSDDGTYGGSFYVSEVDVK